MIAFNSAAGVPRGKAAFHRGQQHSIFASKCNFKVTDIVVQFDLAAKGIALFNRNVKLSINIQRHQFFAITVTQHAYEGVVAVQQFAIVRRNKYSFLHLFEQQPILFFRDAAVRGIANHVDSAFLFAALIGERRCRNHGKAAEAGIYALVKAFVVFLAIGTCRPGFTGSGQNRLAQIPNNVGGSTAQALKQCMICLHHSKFGIMQQDKILNGIESVSPLSLRAQDLLQKPYILYRETQLLRTGRKKFHLFQGVTNRMTTSKHESADGGFLSLHGHDHNMVKSFALQECPHTLAGSGSLDHGWLPSPQNGCQSFIHGGRIMVLQKFLRKPNLLRHYQIVALEQVGPGSIRAH